MPYAFYVQLESHGSPRLPQTTRRCRGCGVDGRRAAATIRSSLGRAHRAPCGQGRRLHRAVDGRRHGGSRHVRSQEIRAVRSRHAGRQDRKHVSRHRYGRRPDQDHRGAGEHRSGHGSGDADPLARAAGSGAHPALAAPVSLAYRLRPAADRGLSAHRCLDGAGAGPEEPGDSAVHQHRAAVGGRGRTGGTEGLHHRRLLRQRVRSDEPAVSGGGGPIGAAAQRHGARPVCRPLQALPPVDRPHAAAGVSERLPAGVAAAVDGQRASAAGFQRAGGLRYLARAEGQLTKSTTRGDSAAAVCWPGGWSRPGLATWRSRPSTCPS